MGFSQDTPSIGGLIGGAAPSRLVGENWGPDTKPVYGGGFRQGGLADMYGAQVGKTPYQAKRDPYYDQWAAQGDTRQLNDRQQLSDLYAQLQKQAAGGMTPQQQQLLDNQQQGAGLQANIANSAAGGAYAQSAARGALLQNRGVQGMQDVQQQQQLKAADMMSATQQMQKVSQMQRAQDLQAQGLTAEDAMRQAEAEVKARGLNIDRSVGYAGLEAGSIGYDNGAYMDALRRLAGIRQQNIKNSQQDFGTAMGIGGQISSGIGKMFGGG